jgi:hypothetical protein
MTGEGMHKEIKPIPASCYWITKEITGGQNIST